MTFVVAGPCIDVKDKSCAEVCPIDCIHVEAEDRMCYIDPAVCINCAVCVEACPVAAISDEANLTAETRPFLRINAEWFSDKAAARAAVNQLKPSGLQS